MSSTKKRSTRGVKRKAAAQHKKEDDDVIEMLAPPKKMYATTAEALIKNVGTATATDMLIRKPASISSHAMDLHALFLADKSNKMQLLFTHRDLPLVVVRFLAPCDVAILRIASKQWHVWLDSTIMCIRAKGRVHPATFPLLVNSLWAQRHITALSLSDLKNVEETLDPTMRTVSLLIGKMKRIERFSLTLKTKMFTNATSNNIQMCLSNMPHLKHLIVRANGNIIKSCIEAISSVPHIRFIHFMITTGGFHIGNNHTVIDFSKLSTLEALEVFRFDAGPQFRCTPQQVTHISACRSLRKLEAGAWHIAADVFPDHMKETIDSGIGALARSVVSRRKKQRLLEFDLKHTDVTSAVWDHVSTMTNLRTLNPYCWKISSSQDWMKLSHFCALRELSLNVTSDADVVSIGRAIYTLKRLHILAVRCIAIPRLVHIVATVGGGTEKLYSGRDTTHLGVDDDSFRCFCNPHLRDLTLSRLRISSDALKLLPKRLHSLEINLCSSFEGHEPLQPRKHLPKLTLLSKLTVYEPMDTQMSKLNAIALNDKVLERFPSLQRTHYFTNDT